MNFFPLKGKELEVADSQHAAEPSGGERWADTMPDSALTASSSAADAPPVPEQSCAEVSSRRARKQRGRARASQGEPESSMAIEHLVQSLSRCPGITPEQARQVAAATTAKKDG